MFGAIFCSIFFWRDSKQNSYSFQWFELQESRFVDVIFLVQNTDWPMNFILWRNEYVSTALHMYMQLFIFTRLPEQLTSNIIFLGGWVGGIFLVVSDELHALNNSRKCAVTFEQYQITVTSSNVDCSCFHFKGQGS